MKNNDFAFRLSKEKLREVKDLSPEDKLEWLEEANEWIDRSIETIRRYHMKEDLQCVMETVGPGGELIPLEVQIYSEYSERAGTDTTRVSLGRWVTEDVWIAISSSIGQERDIKANLDYKISDKWSLSADYENDNESQVGNVGLDLKWRLEF